MKHKELKTPIIITIIVIISASICLYDTLCLCPQAHIVFKPSLQQQRKCENCTGSAIDGVFTVRYDVNRDSNAGELQVSHTLIQVFTN